MFLAWVMDKCWRGGLRNLQHCVGSTMMCGTCTVRRLWVSLSILHSPAEGSLP
ncbi:Os12g0532600 [Oryza sativa Japonica Group]|uniref:Os12g0532600 protein n=1 Tax=Oryza sativa subsp. japonica TaxID=39947 RepID=A0A0N7KU51_ORYSJ|nr:hypothetical protein EE612_059936 [Oryza sativa]KAF2908132.1 hypothetical protein DAI22_12g160400 [Oryza sativa Japonica Group]BAT17442.1 Os12g0532600 [Oryza sativa Japonica Group]